MRVYTIKYKKDIEIPAEEPSSVDDFTMGPFVRKMNECELCLFKTKKEAQKQARKISENKGFDINCCEIVSMYIDESEALFCLYDIAFGIFPDFRKCVKINSMDFT